MERAGIFSRLHCNCCIKSKRNRITPTTHAARLEAVNMDINYTTPRCSITYRPMPQSDLDGNSGLGGISFYRWQVDGIYCNFLYTITDGVQYRESNAQFREVGRYCNWESIISVPFCNICPLDLTVRAQRLLSADDFAEYWVMVAGTSTL